MSKEALSMWLSPCIRHAQPPQLWNLYIDSQISSWSSAELCTTKEEIGKTAFVPCRERLDIHWVGPFYFLPTGWNKLFWQTESGVTQNVHSHSTEEQWYSTLTLNFMHLAIKSIQAMMALLLLLCQIVFYSHGERIRQVKDKWASAEFSE